MGTAFKIDDLDLIAILDTERIVGMRHEHIKECEMLDWKFEKQDRMVAMVGPDLGVPSMISLTFLTIIGLRLHSESPILLYSRPPLNIFHNMKMKTYISKQR